MLKYSLIHRTAIRSPFVDWLVTIDSDSLPIDKKLPYEKAKQITPPSKRNCHFNHANIAMKSKKPMPQIFVEKKKYAGNENNINSSIRQKTDFIAFIIIFFLNILNCPSSIRIPITFWWVFQHC